MTVNDDMDATNTPIETTLRDGRRVRVRPVEPGDRAQFVEAFDKLSPRSRYLRFHSGMEELTEQQLDYLTQVDQVDHVAWVAIDLDAPEHPGIGVARFVRLDDEPEVAEAAVTVLDAYQGQGLGTFLLRLLAVTARNRGVATFRAYVLGENRAMLWLLSELGSTHRRRGNGVYEIDVALDVEDETTTPSSTVGDVLRAVTGKQLPAMHTTAPPAWLPDDGSSRDEAVADLRRQWLDRLLLRRPGPRDGGDRS